MKTIKAAVIEFNGVWPEQAKHYNWFVVCTKGLGGKESELRLEISEFESEAKRLGYINGYRYGIEYPTNGKRPELTDDVLVDIKTGLSNVWLGWDDMEVADTAWTSVDNNYPATHFKVIDPRYKPADTSYLNAPTQAQSLKHKAADELSGINVDNEVKKELSRVNMAMLSDKWHERGELPPVGVECELKPYWHKIKIIAHDGVKIVYWDFHEEEYGFTVFGDFFRPILPIRTEREKVIEAAFDIAVSGGGIPVPAIEYTKELLGKLHDAGMLVLPPKKSDTEE